MRWPAHLQKFVDASQNDRSLRGLSLSLAPLARKLLEEQKGISEEHLAEFVTQIRRLTEWKDSGEDAVPDHYKISSIAGGLAVLVIQHREWLRKNSEIEKWCLSTLRDLRPVDSEHDSPHSINDHSAEMFLGEAGVALLTESGEEWVLRLAFSGVTGAHYNATLFSMWRAYLLRERLGGRFGELVNVVVLWSALRRAAIRDGGYYGNVSEFPKYRGALFKRFMDGALKILNYYEQKIVPSSREPESMWGLRGGDHGEAERWFERLPLFLREEPKRLKVVKALRDAMKMFQTEK